MTIKNDTVDKEESILAKIPKIPNGEAMRIVNLNGDYVLCELNDSEHKSNFDNYVDKADYDVRKLEHLYDRLLDKENASYSTTSEELTNLAKNTQSNIDKVVKVNGLVAYNINKDDLIGRTVEIIENNINSKYTINYPSVNTLDKKSKKKETKMQQELKLAIETFNNQIDIPKLIRNCVVSTYIEGNYVPYLKGDLTKGYGIVKYPLGIVEITTLNIDGEPIVAFNVQDLKSTLQSSISKYGKMKAKSKVEIEDVLLKQVERDYPSEVSEAYKVGDKFTYLDPSRVGVVRINNLGKPYGVTPIFKALPPLLTLETIDDVDRKTIKSKAKKVFFQKLRKEMINEESKTFDTNAMGYSQASLLKAMQDDVVIYTGTPYVESLEILEPKTDVTDNDTVMSNRNRVLNALGISFMTSESKAGQNTVELNYKELLRTINKIVSNLQGVINKFYRTVCEENGFPLEYTPSINIESTLLLDFDTKLRLVDTLFSKVGASYKTTFELLDIDYAEEIQRRKEENEANLDTDIFIPHANSFTSNSNELLGGKDKNNTKNSNGSTKSENKDKSNYDKERNQTKV